MSIFETLSKLSDKQRKKDNQTRKDPSYIYLDENNQIKEIPLSKLNDSSASVYINRTIYKDSLKLIHDSIF